MKRLIMIAAAALVATLVAAPVAAQSFGAESSCRPEPGDLRITRWTAGRYENSSAMISHTSLSHNSITLSVILQANADFSGRYSADDFPADVPRLVGVAVMGNDATAGTVVWGRDVGEIGATAVRGGPYTFDGLKPNTHYVAVLYSPYLGYGNLRPLVMVCFRTARDPNNPWGGTATGCFAPYTPTVDGTLRPANYTACKTARDACNNNSATTWEEAGNRCIPASN